MRLLSREGKGGFLTNANNLDPYYPLVETFIILTVVFRSHAINLE